MWQFLSGTLVSLVVVVPVVFYLCKKVSEIHSRKNRNLQFEELGKFTGELVHEIKNPLSTIKVNLRLANEAIEEFMDSGSDKVSAGKDEPRLARALKKINIVEKEADRLEQILNSFLRYIDRSQLQLADSDINVLVGDMVDFYSPQAYSNSITIRMLLHKEPLICKIDENMLKQVLLNLFINAQQAMKEGGELMVRTDKQNHKAIIQVGDTGCGISPERLNDLFNIYDSSKTKGSGFGLPTAKKIVERHDGRIKVESEQGKGTLFTIELPMRQ